MKRLRKTKAQLQRENEGLRRINRAIGATVALDEVLRDIIDEVVRLFAAQSASVILLDHERKETEIHQLWMANRNGVFVSLRVGRLNDCLGSGTKSAHYVFFV